MEFWKKHYLGKTINEQGFGAVWTPKAASL